MSLVGGRTTTSVGLDNKEQRHEICALRSLPAFLTMADRDELTVEGKLSTFCDEDKLIADVVGCSPFVIVSYELYTKEENVGSKQLLPTSLGGRL